VTTGWLSRQNITTLLTFIVSVAWLVTFYIRVFTHKTIDIGPGLDAALLAIIGYWFATTGTKIEPKNNGTRSNNVH
jgi:hypothetical protein